MTEQLLFKQYSQLPESLKLELLQFFEFLVFKYRNQLPGKWQQPFWQKQESASAPIRKAPKAGFLKGTFVMSPDFDEPLEDFKEYMP